MKTYKIVLIGETSTGKTSIIRQYTQGTFSSAHLETVMPDQHFKNSRGCSFNIVDTAGSKEWESMNKYIYHGTNAAIFVCSYDKQQSLTELKESWLPRIQEETSNIPHFLAVNKFDISDDDKVIENNQIMQAKSDLNAVEVFNVSAKENINIDELFNAVANYLIHSDSQPQGNVVNVNGGSEKKGNCCN